MRKSEKYWNADKKILLLEEKARKDCPFWS